MGSRTSFAARIIADPPAREYRPVLRGLIRALLPFEHPRFPAIPSERIERRLLDLFPIDAGEPFLALQRGLLFFNRLDLFPHIFAPLVRAERAGSPDGGAPAERLSRDDLAGLRAGEESRYDHFRASLEGSPARFTELSLADQRAYLRMWGVSGLTAKRQFARSAKSLVMVSAYSMEEMWQVIGYEGPLLEKRYATP